MTIDQIAAEALEEYDEAEYLLIVAVAHCSREPGYWKHRIP